ncbi:MAG: amidohydrolase family protein, partial [Patescibacteria group bacterium]|nr:amidohydrolase family protein [Patescibacteria group bacterium]
MNNHWLLDKKDETVARTLTERLPSTVFDVHAHLYKTSMINVPHQSIFATGPDDVTPDVWRDHVGRQVGAARLRGALFIPAPMVPLDLVDQTNAWTLKMAATCENARALALVAPGMSQAQIEPLLTHPAFAGFKPYHVYASTQPTPNATPDAYIPEWVWPMANEHGLTVTLHLVRAGGMADPENIRYLRDHCLAYPAAKVILAHAGRAFHAPNAAAGVGSLRDLDNLWFDTAAICESEPLIAILDACGPRRLLWGSDFPVSQQRGRAVTAGDGFLWITPDMVDPRAVSPCRLLPIGLESLRALMTAADL